MKKIPLFCICLLLSFITFAQKNYKKAVIFKTSGDSVQCFVNDKEWLQNPSVISIKKTADGDIETLSINDVKSIVIENGDHYQSARVKIDITPSEFLTPYIDPQLIKTDEATALLLLEYSGNPFKLLSLRINNRLHIYLQKNQDTPEELIYRKVTLTKDGIHYETEDKTFIEQLGGLITGCEKADRKSRNANYSIKEVTTILKVYDVQCGGNTVQYLNEKSEKDKWAIIAIGGFSINKTAFTSASSFTNHHLVTTNPLKSDPSFSAGIRLNYTLPRLNKKLSVLADIYYNSYTASVTENSSFVSNDLYTKKTLTLNPSLIRSGLVARYRFLPGAFHPFIQAGFGASFTISHKESVVYDDYYNGQSHITSQNPYEDIAYKKTQAGFFILGAGVEYKRISIDYKYEPAHGTVNVSTIGSSVKTSTLLLGFRINK